MKNKYIKAVYVLICIEIVLQIVSYGRYLIINYRNNISSYHNWYFADKKNDWWLKEISSIKPDYHPFLGFIFRDIHTPHVNYNQQERLTANNPQPNSESYKKIFFFGGSAIAGHAVRDEETIPSYVAQKLNNPSPQYSITNYGQFGYNSNQELLMLLFQLKSGNVPDLVVFYDGCNDLILTKNESPLYVDTVSEMYIGNLIRKIDLNPHVENTSLINKDAIQQIVSFSTTRIKLIHYPLQIIHWLLQRFGKQTPINKPDSSSSTYVQSLSRRLVENYVKNAHIIDALAKQYNFNYLLLWQPLSYNKTLKKDEVVPFDETAYNINQAIYATSSALLKESLDNHFIDLTNIFQTHADKLLFFDYCHTSAEGNSIVADSIVPLITQHE